MGETLPEDPMADVLTMTTGQGVVRLGGSLASNGVGKRDGGFAIPMAGAALLGKFDPGQPRDENGRWVG